MIKCPVCGYENKEGAQYCLNCGSPMQKEKVSQPADDVSEEQTVLLDPGAMQARIQDEIRRQRESSSGQHGKPESAPPPPARQATPPPPVRSTPPPPPVTAPPSAQPASRPAMQPPPVSAPAPMQQTPAPVPVSTPAPVAPAPAVGGGEPRKWIVAFLVAIFLGGLGVHRFYVGKILTGVLMLVTGGGCGIWWLIDVIMIALDKFKDAQGRDLVK